MSNKAIEKVKKALDIIWPSTKEEWTKEKREVTDLLDRAIDELAETEEENKRLKDLLRKLAIYADTSWYQGSSPHSNTARFYRAMRAIERHISQALKPPKCKTCGGSGNKPRDKHCKLGMCVKKHDRITCRPNGVQCEFYIPTEPCPDCKGARK